MQLTVLSVPDCPNLPVLTSRLHQLLTDRPDLQVAYQVVTDATQAARAGMRGSPTLLVDGVDPFASPGTPASVTCRLYQDTHGDPEGAPSLAALRQVLPGVDGNG